MTYQEAFFRSCQFDPFNHTTTELKKTLIRHNLDNVTIDLESDLDAGLFVLMSHVVEPYLATLEAPVAVLDFPVSQAALAKIHNGRAQRFEIYYKGIELVNGFNELTDYEEQSERFARDNAKRLASNRMPMPIDPDFLAALKHGIPQSAGAALGLDRFFALMYQKNTLQLPFGVRS